jgi:glycosyltransferase involved in cell wall biosynthesis
MTTLSVVIPAYNEERGIADIARRVLAVRPDLASSGVEDLEVLIVDDGSADATARIAEAQSGVRLVRHARNRGYGAALKTGFRTARGELIGFLDADGTYPPEWFPRLCRAALNGSELVIGSRMAGEASKMPITRRVGNWFFAWLLTMLTAQRVTDSASGMRVFRREILESLYPLPDGLNLTPVMSVRAAHEGIRMAEIAIPYDERLGRSKLSVVRDGSTFLQSILWTALSYNPVRIIGAIGALGVLASLLVGLGVLVARLTGVTSLGPWGVAAVYFGMVAGVVGISLFGLGATFNYLVGLFHTRSVRQGLFGRPIFRRPLELSFGRIGGAMLLLGVILGTLSVVLGVQGWPVERLWLYLLATAMSILVGVQLMTSWVVIQVLQELSLRDDLAANDLLDAVPADAASAARTFETAEGTS